MAASLKSLQTALDKLTEYIAPMESNRKYLEQCAATIKEHEKVSTELETQLDGLVKGLKKSKGDSISADDEKTLDQAIKKWGRTQLSLELKNSSAYCDTLLKYLTTALKEVPKAT